MSVQSTLCEQLREQLEVFAFDQPSKSAHLVPQCGKQFSRGRIGNSPRQRERRGDDVESEVLFANSNPGGREHKPSIQVLLPFSLSEGVP